MPDFKELLGREDSIFLDKNALSPHFVPEELPFRDREITGIMMAVAPMLEGRKGRNLFVYGKTGTGKSVCTKRVLEKLGREGNEKVASVYMNCRVYDSRYKVLQKTISEFKPSFAKTGYSFAVLYEKLLDWVEEEGRHVAIALDEIDMVKDLDNLVYTLTRANDDLRSGSVSLLGISNKIDFKQRLDVRSKSSLCEDELVFQPYDSKQLQGILSQRASLAFKQGAVEDSAISLASAIAASENGDARYALSLLLRAGELCDSQAKKSFTDVEVEQSRKAADEDKAYEIISTLPEHQQLLLYALATLAGDAHYRRLVEEQGERFYFSGEVYERYRSTVKKLGKEPRTSRWYREYLHDLEVLGLISTIQSGKGIRGHTTLIRCAYEPTKIREVIEKRVLAE